MEPKSSEMRSRSTTDRCFRCLSNCCVYVQRFFGQNVSEKAELLNCPINARSIVGIGVRFFVLDIMDRMRCVQ